MEILTVFIIFAVFYLIIFSVSIATVVINMIYAKKNGAKNWGLLLLPFGAEYVLGQLADKYEDKKARVKFPIIAIPMYLFTFVFVVAYGLYFFALENELLADEAIIGMTIGLIAVVMLFLVIAIAYSVYAYFVYYRIFAYKNRENAPIWLVATILANIALPIFQLVNMNKPGYSKDEMKFVPAVSVALTQETVSNEADL